jgi:hypothetical protein
VESTVFFDVAAIQAALSEYDQGSRQTRSDHLAVGAVLKIFF